MKNETELHPIQIFSSYLTENRSLISLHKVQGVSQFVSVCPYNY